MALREVKPLNNEQWEKVTTQLKNGPTEKSIETVVEAIEFASKLKEA